MQTLKSGGGGRGGKSYLDADDLVSYHVKISLHEGVRLSRFSLHKPTHVKRWCHAVWLIKPNYKYV